MNSASLAYAFTRPFRIMTKIFRNGHSHNNELRYIDQDKTSVYGVSSLIIEMTFQKQGHQSRTSEEDEEDVFPQHFSHIRPRVMALLRYTTTPKRIIRRALSQSHARQNGDKIFDASG